MSTKPADLDTPAPDRLFSRTVGIVLCTGLVLALVGYFVMDLALRRQAASAELAMISAGEAAAARTVAGTLDRLLIVGAGPGRSTVRTKLSWDIERLIEHEEERLAAIAAASQSGEIPRSGLLEAADTARELALQPVLGDRDAERLKGLFEGQILPQLDLIAGHSRADAARIREAARWAVAGALALYCLGGAALILGVVRPARERIGAWVALTDENDRENRFRLLHDALTRMPNAAYLHAYLTRLIAGSDRRETQVALLRIDLDRFRILHETLGKSAGDEILRIAARRLQQALRSGDFAAYLGQESFVVVTSEMEDRNAAAIIAQRVQASLAQPFSVRGGARRITCSIGVALLSDDHADADLLLGNAGIALAEAQGAGTGSIRYFREDLRLEVERREILFTELLSGLETGEVVAFYQPQIDLRTGTFCGFEALVRWQHPRHGLLTPAAFLEFADETDLTEHIGEVVLTQSLEALQAWDRAGLEVPKVGVNFALAQLSDPRLIEKIKWEVERLDVDPARLALEVLETVLIKSDTDVTVRNLRGLASAGFRIELDDFGTGHASIQNLRRFMVNRIKIDRSFVNGIETSEEQQQLTASMIAMAHALGIETLAEGVESEDAEEMLRRLGCDYFQGFLVARPMSLSQTIPWLRSFRPRAPAAPDEPTGNDPARAGSGQPNTP